MNNSEYNEVKGFFVDMKKNWIKVFCFLVVLLMYFIPSLIFKPDNDYYYSLEGPHLPGWAFTVAWSIIYVCMSIYVTYFIFLAREKRNAEYKRVFIFLIVNFILQASYTPIFFTFKNIFAGFGVTLFTFITAIILFLEALLVNKKVALLTIPYIVWTAIASVLSILLYLQN